jgi:hypothetical protein
MSKVTLGNCLLNSSLNLVGRSKPVSKTTLSLTGSLPQVGPAAVPLPDADPTGALPELAVAPGVEAGDCVDTAPGGAQAAARIIATATAPTRKAPRAVPTGSDAMLTMNAPPSMAIRD